jgi:hypothetical protein
MFFIAGSQLNKTAANMADLRSQSGTSLAEVYYQEVGGISKGLGFMSYGLGIGIIGISIALGSKLEMGSIVQQNSNNNQTSSIGNEVQDDLNNLGIK